MRDFGGQVESRAIVLGECPIAWARQLAGA